MRSPVAYPLATLNRMQFACTAHTPSSTVATTQSLSWRTP